MRSGVDGDCRRHLGPRVTFGETGERGTVGNVLQWNRMRQTKATAIPDGCTFGCKCVVAAGWQFVTTLPQLARKMQRTPDQQMLVRMRRGIVTSIRQTRDRLETAQSVAAEDDMLGEEESGDILGRPHSSVQSCLRRLHVNLSHPKKQRLSQPYTRALLLLCPMQPRYIGHGPPYSLSCGRQVPDVRIPHYRGRQDGALPFSVSIYTVHKVGRLRGLSRSRSA